MFTLKKLLVSLGIAGAMAVASAPASAALSLDFINGNGATLLSIPDISFVPNGNGRSFNYTNANLGGWNVQTSFAFSSSSSGLPALALTGTFFRVAAPVDNNLIAPGIQNPTTVAGYTGNQTMTMRFRDTTITPLSPATGTPIKFESSFTNLKYLNTGLGYNVQINANNGGGPLPGAPFNYTPTPGFIASGTPTGTTSAAFNSISNGPNNVLSSALQISMYSNNSGAGGAGTSSTNRSNTFFFTEDLALTVPEPGSLALLGAALVGLAAVRRKKVAA